MERAQELCGQPFSDIAPRHHVSRESIKPKRKQKSQQGVTYVF